MEWLWGWAGPRATRVLATVIAGESRNQWLWQRWLRWVDRLDGCSTLVASSFGELDVFWIALLHNAPLPLSLLLRRNDHHWGKSRNLGNLSIHCAWLTPTHTHMYIVVDVNHRPWPVNYYVVYLYFMYSTTLMKMARFCTDLPKIQSHLPNCQAPKLHIGSYCGVLPDRLSHRCGWFIETAETFWLAGPATFHLFPCSPFQ